MTLRTLWHAARPFVMAAGVAAAAAGIARIDVGAQGGGGAPPPYTPPPAPRAQAPIDLTGVWASAITEDWQWRMMTPAKGDFIAVPLNADGDKIGKAWDPAADVANKNECKPFGAAGILRLPTRVRFEWVDDKTLKMDMDLGTQTRLLHFDKSQPTGERTWQGYAVAEWIDLPAPGRGRGGGGGTAADGGADPAAGDAGRGAAPAAGGPADAARGGAARGGAPGAGGAPAGGRGGRGGGRGAGRGGPPPAPPGGLKVVTTYLREQYLRRNGVPVSENAVVTEYFDVVPSPTGENWLIVKTVVDDPRYMTQSYIVSSQFKKEPDASKWNPTPCEVIPPAVAKKPVG